MRKQQKRFSAYELNELEDELKKLEQPAIPADLERRLLEAIPALPVGRCNKEPKGSLYGAVGWAAALVVGLGILLYYFEGSISPKDLVVNGSLASRDEILQSIEKEALSAQLLASANLLADYQQGQPIAQKTYQYLAKMYPDTSGGKQAKEWLDK